MESIVYQSLSILVQTLICTYFVLTIVKGFNNSNKLTTKQLVISIILFFTNIITGVLTKRILPFPVNSILASIILFVAIKYVLKVPVLKSILLVFSLFIFFCITEIITTSFGMMIFNTNDINILLAMPNYLVLIVLQALISFLIIKLISLIMNKHSDLRELLKTTNASQILVAIALLSLCVLPQILIFAFKTYNYPITFLILNSLQMILICIVIFVFYKRTLENSKSKADLLVSELHNKTMVGLVDGVRTLKHDYNNIIQALNGYVSTKQYDKLQDHINDVLKECNIVNNLSLIDPEIFNDPAIYGIVGAKYILAVDSDINFDLDITTNIKDIQFPMPELSRILGIIIDNAIEATSKTKNKYIRLEMKFDGRKCADTIRVINTYDTSIQINLDGIYNKGFSTKKIKSGIGLWEVKKLVQKVRHSQVYATVERDKFVQNIIIEKLN